MRTGGVAAVALLTSHLLAGCAHAPPSNTLGPLREAAESRLHVTEPLTGAAPDLDVPVQALTLPTAMRLAIARNPEWRSALLEIGIARADLDAASTLPNPVLGLMTRFPDRAPSAANIEFEVLGNLFDVLLRPRRIAQGRLELESTVLDASAALMSLAGRVQSAYLEAIAARARVGLLQELCKQTASDVADARRLRATGGISATAVTRAEALSVQTEIDLLQAEQDETDSRGALARVLGLDGETARAIEVPAALPRLPDSPPTPSAPAAQARKQRYELHALAKIVARRTQEMAELGLWHWLPGLHAGIAGERTSEGALALGPKLEMELPLFDRGEARRARATSALAIAEQRLRSATLDAEREAESSAANVLTRHAAARLWQARLVPLRERVLELARELRALGGSSLEDLATARQEMLRANLAGLDAVKDYWLAEAALHRALGDGPAEPGPEP